MLRVFVISFSLIAVLVACGSETPASPTKVPVTPTPTPSTQISANEAIANVRAHLGKTEFKTGATTYQCSQLNSLDGATASHLGNGHWKVTSKNGKQWDYFETSNAVARVGSSIC